MALQKEILSSVLLKTYGKHGTAQEAGEALQKAIKNYIQSIMGPSRQSGFTAMPGLNILGLAVGSIYQSQMKIPNTIAQRIGTEIDKAFKTLKTSLSTKVVTSSVTLIEPLKFIYSNITTDSTSFSKNMAKAIHAYAISMVIIEIIPGTPPVTVIGPPS